MDRDEHCCRLDWWANPSTLLGSAEIAVVITATSDGWDAHARLLSDNDDEHATFTFLHTLDPIFTLPFELPQQSPMAARPPAVDQISSLLPKLMVESLHA